MYGLIAYFQLTEWWLDVFNEQEIRLLKSTYKDEEDFDSLINSEITYSSQTVVGFLESMGYRLNCLKHFELALKFLSKGELLITKGKPSEVHFLYRVFIEYYSEFSPNVNIDKQIEYAQKQINIGALASKEMIDKSCQYKISHRGYELYYSFLKSNNRLEEAKALKAKARKEKWNYSYF